VEERTRELTALLEVSRSLASTLELEQLLGLILDQLLRVIEYRSAGMFLARGDALETVAGRDIKDPSRDRLQVGHRRPLAQVMAIWQTLLSGQPLLIGDLRREDDPLADTWRTATKSRLSDLLSLPMRSWMAVPLSVRGQVVGYLALTREVPDGFTAHDLELALAFAGHAAVAIDNARLLDESEERARELATLLEVSRSVASTLELEPLLGAIIDQAKVVADYDGASVLTFEDGALQVIYRRAPDDTDRPDRVGVSFPAERTPLFYQYIYQGQSLIIDDVRGDEPLARSYREMMGVDPAETPYLRYVRAWMGIPLALKDRVIGVIVLVHAQPGYYTPHHAELVTAMASQAAVAIENARLYAHSREVAALEERARLARDLHDSVTQSVFSVGLLTNAALGQSERGMPVEPTLRRIKAVAQDALAELRALLYELHPATLAEEGLSKAVQKLIGAMQVRLEVPIHVTVEVEPGCRVSPERETAIFRIVQEALGNAAKYAQATALQVTLAQTESQLRVTVADNGAGFDPAAPVTPSADGARGGMGLRSMRERAITTGMLLQVESEPGHGTRITVTAPLTNTERP
jgi:signal transduction histidine kinase